MRLFNRDSEKIGRRTLRIEEEARTAGLPVLCLETGVRQPEAIALYQKRGFRRCNPFGAYAAMPADRIEASLFFEKALDLPAGDGATVLS